MMTEARAATWANYKKDVLVVNLSGGGGFVERTSGVLRAVGDEFLDAGEKVLYRNVGRKLLGHARHLEGSGSADLGFGVPQQSDEGGNQLRLGDLGTHRVAQLWVEGKSNARVNIHLHDVGDCGVGWKWLSGCTYLNKMLRHHVSHPPRLIDRGRTDDWEDEAGLLLLVEHLGQSHAALDDQKTD